MTEIEYLKSRSCGHPAWYVQDGTKCGAEIEDLYRAFMQFGLTESEAEAGVEEVMIYIGDLSDDYSYRETRFSEFPCEGKSDAVRALKLLIKRKTISVSGIIARLNKMPDPPAVYFCLGIFGEWLQALSMTRYGQAAT